MGGEALLRRIERALAVVVTLVAALTAGLFGSAEPTATTAIDAQDAGDRQTVRVPGLGFDLTLVHVPAGELALGSAPDEPGRDEDEGPRRRVVVDAFWMTAHEITHDQFAPFRYAERDMAPDGGAAALGVDAIARPTQPYQDPSGGMPQGDHPVTGVTRHAAIEYARWLSARTGRPFRLPTEAEWEYACRAGGGGPATPIEDVGWLASNADGAYHPVGTRSPNAWGLFDLLGNAAEWVLDEYVNDAYATLEDGVRNPVVGRPGRGRGIVRGGSFDDPPERLRCADRVPESAAWKARDPQMPKSRWWNTDSPHVGFRLVSPDARAATAPGRASGDDPVGDG